MNMALWHHPSAGQSGRIPDESQSRFGYAKRYLPLTARAAGVLSECRKLAKPATPWVCTSFDGRRRMGRNWVSEQFAAIRDKLGLPWDCVLHSTRHTFCTRLGESGCDAFTIQRLAGHNSIVISQTIRASDSRPIGKCDSSAGKYKSPTDGK